MEYVYYAEIASGHVKIGRSKRPSQRRKSIQTGCPYPIEKFLVMPCEDSRLFESSLHERYSQYRASGEWFALPELERAILRRKFEDAPDVHPDQRDRMEVEDEIFSVAKKLYYEVHNQVDDGFSGTLMFGGDFFNSLCLHQVWLNSERDHWKRHCLAKAAIYLAGAAYLAKVKTYASPEEAAAAS